MSDYEMRLKAAQGDPEAQRLLRKHEANRDALVEAFRKVWRGPQPTLLGQALDAADPPVPEDLADWLEEHVAFAEGSD